MRSLPLWPLLLAGALLSAPGHAAQSTPLPSSPAEVPIPPLRPFALPEPVRLELETGASLLVIPIGGVPLIDGTLLLPGGRQDEDEDLVGITELMAGVLREGGSERTSGRALDEWLDSHAASLTCTATDEALRIDFSCVARDLGNLLVLLGELLRQPAYPEAALERVRARLETRIARRAEDPGWLADLWLDRLTAGEDSLLARRPSTETLARITRRDLLRHHRALVSPERLLVGATGAVQPESLAAQLDTQLRGLPEAGPRPRREPQVLRRPSRITIHLLDRPGLAQCELRLAAPGVRRLHGDAAALRLWSAAVGAEGAANRMMVRMRAGLGLIYEGRLAHEPGWARSGRVLGSCSTRVAAGGETVGAWLEVLRGSLAPLPSRELDSVRQRVLNSGVFELDSPAELLDRALEAAFHRYPTDHWERSDERLRRLSAEEVAQAVQRRVDPERMTIVVVGPAEELAPQLEPYGQVVLLPAGGPR